LAEGKKLLVIWWYVKETGQPPTELHLSICPVPTHHCTLSGHTARTLLPWVKHLESRRKNAVAQAVRFRGWEAGNWLAKL